MKLIIEVPVYRKTTKKLLALVEKLGQGRIGKINHNESGKTFEFSSLASNSKFNISDSYFRNPNSSEVEFKRFKDFRSVLNLIIAVSNEETNIEVSLIENSDEIINEPGIYSNITLSVSTTSTLQFNRIAQHLDLLGSS